MTILKEGDRQRNFGLFNHQDNQGDAPLHAAAQRGNINAVDALLKIKAVKVNLPNNQGDTPLHLAAQGGHIEVVKALLRKGASLSLTNKQGKTAKDLAIQNGHAEVGNMLANATKYWNRINLNGASPQAAFFPLSVPSENGQKAIGLVHKQISAPGNA